jgi:hypothetical protein
MKFRSSTTFSPTVFAKAANFAFYELMRYNCFGGYWSMSVIFYEYWLDRSDVLIKANDAWFDFYAANTGGGSAKKFIGQTFLDWINGYENQALFASILTRVRSGHQLAEMPFRCDSPGEKRLLSMQVTLDSNSDVHFKTHVLKSESRPSVHWKANDLVTMCGWCNRIAIGKGEQRSQWITVDEAIRSMQLLESPLAPSLTHGICPDCKVEFLNSIPKRKRMEF